MAGKHGKNGVLKLNKEESRKLFDRSARRSLNMSGEEFIRRWEKGAFKNPEHPEVMRLAMLMPLGR